MANHSRTLSPDDRFQPNCSNMVIDSSINSQSFGYRSGILDSSSIDQTNGINDFSGELPPVECDHFGGFYEYIKDMLMEEDDIDQRACTFQDFPALQAAEKYFHEALSDEGSVPLDADCSTYMPQTSAVDISCHKIMVAHEDISNLRTNRSESGFPDSQIYGEELSIDGIPMFSGDFNLEGCFDVRNPTTSPSINPDICNKDKNLPDAISVRANNGGINRDAGSNDKTMEVVAAGVGGGGKGCETSRKKKNRDRGESPDNCLDKRSSKLLANAFAEESEPMEKYDKSLLCRKMNPGFYDDFPVGYGETILSDDEEDKKMRQYRKSTEVKRGRPKGSKKGTKAREVIDLRGLLTLCAQAVSSFNNATAEELLKQIWQHSSPYGDTNERLAHIFANALEARIAGTGSALYAAIAMRRTPAAELLKSYQTYVTACPFKRMSNIFADKSIGKLVKDAERIHIVDFGILYGFQWPCFIQGLSLKPGGAPRLKITGIDFPQPGFKPTERIEQTGRRLMAYCKRFNVPFEFRAVVKRFEDVCLEDLDIDRDEMLVVNCLYRLRHVPDESAGMNSPRNAVLKLIRSLNPDLFVHGIMNGTYNTSFFETRFREALYHYSSFFDMMEATIPRGDQDRSLYEREVFGRDILNVIACEGDERVERPETYKQWQVRNQRAGFKLLPLNREIFREVKVKVGRSYHNDFLVEEESGWMLQGWKGRVLYALSCWKPSLE